MKPLFLAAAFALLLAQAPPVYQDPRVPLDRRVDDLISRMTVAEKISQLMSDSPALERLGIPAYNWWNESLHGVGRAGRATVYNSVDGRPACANPTLLNDILRKEWGFGFSRRDQRKNRD